MVLRSYDLQSDLMGFRLMYTTSVRTLCTVEYVRYILRLGIEKDDMNGEFSVVGLA